MTAIAAWPAQDLTLLTAFNGIRSPALDQLMQAASNAFAWLPVLAPLAIALLLWGRVPLHFTPPRGPGLCLWARDSRAVLLAMLLATGLSDLSANAIKHSVGRQRPCRDPDVAGLVVRRVEVHGNRSFPSSHAANSAALATVAGLAYPPLAAPGAIFSLVVGASRVYNGVHYPLDVAAGWMVGMISGAAVWAAVKKRLSVAEVISYAGRFRGKGVAAAVAPPGSWQQLRFRSLDGWNLEGCLARRGDRVAVICHGLHSDISMMATPAGAFLSRGFSVLLVPFRGHDSHPLPRTTGGPDEAMDLTGAILALLDSGFRGEDILLYGSSMGAAVAVKSASLLSTGPLMGVIAHGCYTGFFESARVKLGPWRAAVLKAVLPAPSRRSLVSFRPADYLAQASRDLPFVFMCGSWDSVTPPDMSSSLASAAPLGSTVVMGGAGHPRWGDPSRENAWQFEKALDQALDLVASRQSGKSVFVDESGKVRDVPRLTTARAVGRGSGR